MLVRSLNVSRHLSADFRRVLISLALINVFVVVLIAVALVSSYNTHRQLATVAASNVSRVLVENLERFIDKVDLCLISAAIEAQRLDAAEPDDREKLTVFLNSLSEQVRESLRLTVTDADGVIWAKTVDVDTELTRLDKNESFRHVRQNPVGGLFLAVPTSSDKIEKTNIGLSRGLVDGNGHFAGIVRATIGLDRLAAILSTIELGRHGAITVTDMNGGVLARVPFDPGNFTGLIGKTLTKMSELLGQGETSGVYHVVSVVDGIERTYFFRRVANRSLYVLVGIADQDVLPTWYHEIWVMSVLFVLFLVISVLAAVLIFRNGRAREAAIAELERKEEALTLFRQAIDRSNDAILVIDNETARLVDFNQAACDQLGYSSEEVGRLTVMDIDIALPSLDHWRYRVENTPDLKTGVTMQCIHRRKDGTHFTVEISWRSVEVSGRDLSISVERDATEKERIEREMLANTAELERTNAALRESNADLERFASLASHDLQTPLRTIVSFGQLLRRRNEGLLDDEGKEFLAFIIDGAKRMSNLIKDLLQYSRTTSEPPLLKRVSVLDSLGVAVANLHGAVSEMGAKIEIGDLPDVMAEQMQLTSLLQNLIENALKYRRPGVPPVISVSAEPYERGWWRISVADNGIGIDPAYHRKVFEIFQRLDPAGSVEGTGIGLSVCQRIAHHFGGDIWVESNLGEGAVFHFSIRAADTGAAG